MTKERLEQIEDRLARMYEKDYTHEDMCDFLLSVIDEFIAVARKHVGEAS